MPHLTLDYSANLTPIGDIPALCNKLAACLLAQRADGKAVYPIGGTRVRGFAADAWCIGDGALDAAYLHAALRVGTGRTDAVLRATGDALFEVMKSHFAELYERMGLALTLEITESGESGSWKHNNLHARYRKA